METGPGTAVADRGSVIERRLKATDDVYDILENPVCIPLLKEWGERIVGEDLSCVPGYRELPDGQTNEFGTFEDPRWRADFFAWRIKVVKVRNWIQDRCRRDHRFRLAELARCKSDPCWFILMWLDVEEPRSDEESYDEDDGDFETIKPFILFAYQAKVVYLFCAIVALPFKFDFFISKARGVGITYAVLAAAFWGWLFRKYRGRFLSEKFEKAERSLDLDSLFGKLDLFFESIPEWMMPTGFYGKSVKNRQIGMYKNPVTKAQLTAEATTKNAVRGGRGTYSCSDECAFQMNYRKTRSTISGSTNHRVDWSSESFTEGRQWWNTWRSAKKAASLARASRQIPVAIVLELEWYENPYQDQLWYDTERARYASDGNIEEFDVEYLRNPLSGYGTYVYPLAGEVPTTPEWWDPSKMVLMSVDPGVNDDCAWVIWQKHFPNGRKLIRWLDSFSASRLPGEVYAYPFTGTHPERDDEFYVLYHDFFDDPRTIYIRDWFAQISPNRIRLYGDPAAKSMDTGASDFRTRLAKQSRIQYAKRGERGSLLILLPPEIIYKRNNHPSRTGALREALAYSEFSQTEGAMELQEAISNVRYGEMTEKTVHAPKPRHDGYTNLTSSAEYGMIYETLKLTPDEVRAVMNKATRQAQRETRTARGRTPEYRQRTGKRAPAGKDPYAPNDKFLRELVTT